MGSLEVRDCWEKKKSNGHQSGQTSAGVVLRYPEFPHAGKLEHVKPTVPARRLTVFRSDGGEQWGEFPESQKTKPAEPVPE